MKIYKKVMKKIKISTQTWNDQFELLDGSYSVTDIQSYFEYVIKKHETLTDTQITICQQN